jgi:hypothetical protein
LIRASYMVFDTNTVRTLVDTYVHGDLTSITETNLGPSPPPGPGPTPGAPGPTPGFGLFGLAGLLLAGGFARARAARG